MQENTFFEKKSIRLVLKDERNIDWSNIIKECVGLANARGGEIILGIEDKDDNPPSEQKIPHNLPRKIYDRITQGTINVIISLPEIKIAANTGEYLQIKVLQLDQGIACTSDGKYFIRVGNTTKPVHPEEMVRLVSEKSAYIWEKQITSVKSSSFDQDKLNKFINRIKNSERVSDFVKNKSDIEILEYYSFIKNGYFTNLGILWVGTKEDRSNLLYAPIIQFIEYDHLGQKISKYLLDDYSLNPLEMIEAVMNDIKVWDQTIEIFDGLFRTNIPIFEKEIIRELLVNALAHRLYTIRGDIFINLYVDRLEVHSPGLLPFGVTPKNILFETIRRNETLAKVFYDLKLMEKEGSGYDKIYEILLSEGKKPPLVVEENDRVVVTIYKQIVKTEIVKLINNAKEQFQITQKEAISLGLIVQNDSLLAPELASILNISQSNELQNWLGRLLDFKIILKKGRKKGTIYYLNPDYIKRLGYKGKTTLKQIEDHRLKELILTDLKKHPKSKISNIQDRIGKEIRLNQIRKILNELLKNKNIYKEGELKGTRYFLS